MNFTITGSNLLTHYINTVGVGANDVTPDTQDRAVVIGSIRVTAAVGATPNLTVEIVDTKTPETFLVRPLSAMVANTPFFDDEPFWLPNGWEIRVTAASVVTVRINYFNPNATGQR